jgi:hypothetical protein
MSFPTRRFTNIEEDIRHYETKRTIFNRVKEADEKEMINRRRKLPNCEMTAMT